MIQERTIVELAGKQGVVISDDFGCCSPDETMVVWDGTTYGLGSPTDQLKIIGRENAVPEPRRCGTGREADCCIFLTVGPKGFECERFGGLRTTLIFRDMHAKRNPADLYPRCMFPEQS